jgi:tetratricopeptide (TPR) repeat protein
MSDVPGNLYSHREQRPSLADECDRDKHVSPIFGGDLLKQLRFMRRRRTVVRRIMLVVALVYAAGMAAFIALLVLRNSVDRTKLTAAEANVTKSQPAASTSAALAPKAMRQAIQQWRDAAERLREARVWIQKGRHDTASALLQGLLADNPNNSEALFELAQIYFQQNDDRARDLVQRLLIIEPQRKAATQMLATLYSRSGQHEQALALANWMLDLDPDSTEAHRVAGWAYLQTNRLDLAAVHFRKWVTADPDNMAAQKQYADVLLAQNEVEKARAIYEVILKKKPDEADTYRQLAICFARKTMVEQSVSTMIQAIYVIGAPKVATWFKDPGFESVRHQKLFALLEKQVTMPQMNAHVVQQPGAQVGPNANFDLRRLEQVQAMLKAHY